MVRLRSPKGTNLHKLAQENVKKRGKDKSPRKNGVLSVTPSKVLPATAKDLLKEDPNTIYWLERVEQMKTMLAEHMKARYKKARKDQRFTPQYLAKVGYEYLKNEIANGRPLTVSGLAYMLGTDAQHLLRLEKLESKDPDKLAFKDIACKLKGFIEMYVEQQLHMRQNPTGSIFVLKNFGWQDKLEVDHTVYAGLTEEERIATKQKMSNFAE